MATGIDRVEAGLLVATSMNGTTYPRNTASFLALCTTVPTSTVAAAEVVGGSYGRAQVAFSITGNVATNSTSVTITGLPAGTIKSVAIYDAASTGNRRWFADLPSPFITVSAGDAVSFAPGTLSFTLGS